jgi:hypothetical protein
MSARSLVSSIAGVALLAMAAIAGLAMGQGTVLGQQGTEIDVTPATATNEVNTEHTVTATVTFDADPIPDADVVFAVIAGPNADTSGTCSPNADCTTDGNGMVSFTYTGDGGVGTDTIQACVAPIATIHGGVSAAVVPIDCVEVEKEWVEPTPTPTPTSTPTATPTPTPTPTATPPVAEAADVLPPTGSEPAAGSSFPWAVVALAVGGLILLAGGAGLLKRAR